MATRTLVLTADEIQLITQWANSAWSDADQARMLTIPASPQEQSALADQQLIESVKAKLRGY